jgi:hypothetical protein
MRSRLMRLNGMEDVSNIDDTALVWGQVLLPITNTLF